MKHDADEIIYMIQDDDYKDLVHLRWGKMRESESDRADVSLKRVPNFPAFKQVYKRVM